METKDTYILLKDLPTLKAGARFIWNSDEENYVDADCTRQDYFFFSQDQIENNPEWFKKEEASPLIDELLIIKNAINIIKNNLVKSKIYYLAASLRDFEKQVDCELKKLNAPPPISNLHWIDMRNQSKTEVAKEFTKEELIDYGTYVADRKYYPEYRDEYFDEWYASKTK